MKIKLFKREHKPDGFYSNGMTKVRLDTNEELENRVSLWLIRK